MKKCLIVINFSSGSSKKISFEKVEKRLGKEFEYFRCALPSQKLPDLSVFQAIAVCGGDGTLGSVLQEVYDKKTDVYYFPVGTLNDKAKAERYSHAKNKANADCAQRQIVVGKCRSVNKDDSIDGAKRVLEQDEEIFTYVFAAGSFTPIGYTSSPREKKKFGTLAYIAKIVKEYRPYRMKTALICDGKKYDDEFTLIMFLKSPRCFGFLFNKAFNPNSASGHLLAIRSPKHNGVLGCAEMFFPFFKAFFIGLKKERDRGSIIFKQVYDATMITNENTVFCKDGERCEKTSGTYKISFKRSVCSFEVIDKFK